ncbi:iron-containing alcohol dehydrogenase [Halalkalibacter krulwichiae]|uniref:NAD-dependent methanol dehydrogenase n=1 Tax=Halalkalibacter krulwichiae TaxID=199441 RepID=A0A1X9M8Q0_9BACI|nr:iron-containing alcohol dehydrogenase [Halalkalibacter krulwichiae]ARK29778.1 NAD-dependent methanol dehydrogenase [Halalkalibacter krulwichiae]
MSSLHVPKEINLEFGSVQKLGQIASDFGATHLFIVIDAFLTQSPLNYQDQLEQICRKHSLEITCFSDFRGEPTTEHLDEAISKINVCGADCIVAMGGGSSIDLAKAISVFAINRGITLDEIEQKRDLKRLPLIAIPTTAGTGSEATKVMVITDSKSNIKKNPGNPKLIPDVAILDPNLTMSLPKHFTVYTGLDALAHAMEAYVSTRATELSNHYALEAIKMVGEALPRVYDNGKDEEARKKMLLASCYAGIAFSNSSTNLAHATARPLGAHFHIPHGLSVALLLPFVIEFGLEAARERYANIAMALGVERSKNKEELAKDALMIVHRYNERFNIWNDGFKYIKPSEFEESIPTLVQDSLSGNGVLTNQIIPTDADVEKIYKQLLKKVSQYSVN